MKTILQAFFDIDLFSFLMGISFSLIISGLFSKQKS